MVERRIRRRLYFVCEAGATAPPLVVLYYSIILLLSLARQSRLSVLPINCGTIASQTAWNMSPIMSPIISALFVVEFSVLFRYGGYIPD